MKKHKKPKKKFQIFWLVAGALTVVSLAVVLFFISQKQPASMYVYPENPKQGDTVFIRVKSEAGQIAGNFNGQNLIFFKKTNSEDRVSFLGIDADQKPGDYQILVDTSNADHLKKEIKVSLASFSTAAVVAAPSSAKTGITNQKAISNIRTKDNPSLNKVLSNFTSSPYFNSPFSNPLGEMKTAGFSFGKFIGFGKSALQHLGVDLSAPEDSKIFAVNDGKVVATLDLDNYGKTIIIDHGLDIFSLYLHLDKFEVAPGQMVKNGQLIGLSGETGYVTAPHLHFSMRVGGARVDPIVFINTSQKLSDNLMLADISSAFINLFSHP